MPAINPARLKIQATELAEAAQNPEDFCLAFNEFLDQYADRTYRPGLVGEPPPLIRSYNVPQQVMGAVSSELTGFAENDRQAALNLTDKLWTQPYLEFRLLAANLLGKVHPMPAKSIVTRIDDWITASTEDRLVDAVITFGLERMRLEQVKEYFQQIDNWFQSKAEYEYRLGLKAIPPLISDSSFEDIPLIFRRVGQAIRSGPTKVKSETLAVIKVLAERYPQETAYFLRETLITAGETSGISWYVRHSLNYFPPDSQAYLRSALQSEEFTSQKGK
jgi:hypothetical protein